MKTKLLAMMLLAGGTMFAQTRFSVGVGVGGYGGGYYQPAPYVAPCPSPYESFVNGYCVEDYGYAQPFYGGYGFAPGFNGRVGARFNGRVETRGFAPGRNGNQSHGNRGGSRGR